MWSGSVIVKRPYYLSFDYFPVNKEIIAKFLSNSQPIAPQPIMNILEYYIFSINSDPTHYLIPSNLSFYG